MVDAHRCDPHLGSRSGGGPLTTARVLRVLLAILDSDGDERAAGERGAAVLTEVGSCALCLSGMLCMTAGVAVNVMPERSPQVIAAFDIQLAAALDELAAERRQGTNHLSETDG